MSLYLVPAHRENLETSIEKDVAPHQLAPHLSSSRIAELQARSGMEGIRCWAMTSFKRSLFEAMQPGDIVLLSEKNTKRFTHYAQVTGKVENKPLGDALWPVKREHSWELIYFLRNIQRIHISKSEFVTKLGYKPNFDVAGTTRVRDAHFRAFESMHGPLSEWLGTPYISIEHNDETSEVRDEGTTDYSAMDVSVLARRRLQHERFATQVKTHYGMSCAMCGITERDFLVAGHIVAWSEDEQNRLNPANGLCLCVMHDRAFERGYLVLDDQLHIRMNPHLNLDSPLGRQLRHLVGQRIRLPVAAPPDPILLKRHRERFSRW